MATQRINGQLLVKSDNKGERQVNIQLDIESDTKQHAIDLIKRASDLFLELGDGKHIIKFVSLS